MPSCVICGEEAATSTRCEKHQDHYLPAGPTIEQFHDCDTFVKLIMGSFGSSKSVACCYDLLFNAMIQPKQKDGKRRSRYAITRSTYRELEDSTIRTWKDWMGAFGDFKVSSNSFMLKYGDIEAEILFRALDKPEDIEKLLSVEYTKAWINEARDVPRAILEALTGRVGRYPSEKDGGCVSPGIIMDTNPPDEDSWIYKLFEVDLHKDPQIQEEYSIFKQPPGAVKVDGRWEDNVGQVEGIPKAENIDNLPDGYYRRMCIGKDDEWIKVYAEGKYGFVQDGKPVFSQYNDTIHCMEFTADPGLPLYIGLDCGLTPSCVIAQFSARGQFRVIDELQANNMGMYQFARDAIKPHLAKNFPGFKINEIAWADPAKTRGEAAEQTAIGVLNDMYVSDADDNDGITQAPLRMPFTAVPAVGGNNLGPRLDSVNQFLTRLIDGAPAFLLHPRCSILRKGFIGRYRYERVQVSGDERYKDMPKKNVYSHSQDALQNLAKGLLGENDAEDEEIDYWEEPASAYSGR